MTATGSQSNTSGSKAGKATIPEMVLAQVRDHPEATILRKKDRGIWKSTSWAELGERARAVGMGLKANGLKPGEAVCILSDTMPEWVYADLGILGAGGVSVGIYTTNDAEEVARILTTTGARTLFVENEEQLDKALEARGNCPDLERIVIFDMKGLRDLDEAAAESLADFMARGTAHAETHAGDWEAGIAALSDDAVAVLALTPGTTGPAKLVMLTHRNLVFQIGSAAELLGIVAGDERLAFLPMSHVVERVLGLYLALDTGTVSNYIENPDTVVDNLREISPTVCVMPPRDWERFRASVLKTVFETGALQRICFNWAMGVGHRIAEARIAGREPSSWHRLQWLVGSALVLRPVRDTLGLDRARVAIATGEPISATLVQWYSALGVDLVEAYSRTESAGLAAIVPGAANTGRLASGAIPRSEIRVSESGEVLIRGDHVFAGYWKDDVTTGTVLVDDWMHTGDAGSADGTVTGRLSDVIAAGDGRKIQPAAIEAELRTSPFISDCLVFGTGHGTICGLISVDHDAIEKWAQKTNTPFTGFASLVASEAVRALINAEIATAVTRLPGSPLVSGSYLIERRFDMEDPELTPMLKFRRAVMADTFKDQIDEMSREV